MAPGPPPADPRRRRRRNAPAGGDWVDLHPLDRSVLPALPRRKGAWSVRAQATWKAWREDPASGQYSPADVAYAIDTAHLVDAFARAPTVALAAEIRQRMDGLGLTPKGRRSLRWRLVDEEPADASGHAPPSRHTQNRRRRLRAVDSLAGRDPVESGSAA